jgi:hypothetical protein
MKKLLRSLFWLLVLNTAAWLGGRYLGKRMSSGDGSTDEFTLATFYGGDTFSSKATALRSGRVRLIMGGLMLDLRDATLDSSGAHLTVETTMGGAMIRVSEEWRVMVDEELTAAEVQVDVTPPEALPAEAPLLHIRVIGRAAGITITSAPGRAFD